MHKSLAYFLVGGFLLAASTLLAKVASNIGLPPLAFLTWSLIVCSVLLLVLTIGKGALPSLNRHTLEYFFVTALVTVAGANLIFFTAVPAIGAGFISLIISLPPLLTYAGALVFGIESFSAVRFAGVCAALTGAAVLAIGKISAPEGAIFWVLLALLGPILLTVGNLYRSLRWPDDEDALGLATGMIVAAVLLLLPASLIPGMTLIPAAEVTTEQIILIGMQGLVFAMQFVVLFLLQGSGGPVLLSLLGTVGAVFGVPSAVLLLGENVPDGLFIGGGLILAGVVLVNMKQKNQTDLEDSEA